MTRPDCQSTAVRRRRQRMALGYRRFRCGICHRRFNERTGTAFNELQSRPTSCCSPRCGAFATSSGCETLAELLLQRGYTVTHETIRAWEFRFTPLISDQLRTRRTGRVGHS